MQQQITETAGTEPLAHNGRSGSWLEVSCVDSREVIQYPNFSRPPATSAWITTTTSHGSPHFYSHPLSPILPWSQMLLLKTNILTSLDQNSYVASLTIQSPYLRLQDPPVNLWAPISHPLPLPSLCSSPTYQTTCCLGACTWAFCPEPSSAGLLLVEGMGSSGTSTERLSSSGTAASALPPTAAPTLQEMIPFRELVLSSHCSIRWAPPALRHRNIPS